MAAPKIYKTIFQARYAPRLRFFELLLSAAQRLPEYPHWRTNQIEITLRDFEKRCSLTLQSKHFGYDQDSGDAELAQTNIRRAIVELPGALEIEEFSRLGLRRIYLWPVDLDFTSLVTVLNVKLLSQDERLREILPPRVEDLLYRIDAVEGEYRYHITAAPVRKPEVLRALSFNEENHLAPETAALDLRAVQTGYPDVAILFDIDVYREGLIPVGEAADFVSRGEDLIGTLVTSLGQYLLATDVGE